VYEVGHIKVKGLLSPLKRRWLNHGFGGLFSAKREPAQEPQSEEGAGGTDHVPTNSGAEDANGAKKRRRRRRRRKHRTADGAAVDSLEAVPKAADVGGVGSAFLGTPSFMLPLMSKIKLRAAEEAAARAAADDDPKLDKWRSRWDDKWGEGSGEGRSIDRANAPHAASRSITHVPRASRLDAGVRSSVRAPSHDPLRSSMSENRPSMLPPSSSSSWGLVRARVNDITQMV